MENKIYPKISVVTPNYNQGDYIELTIQSVLNQNYPNLEYIIIDGGSTDNSTDIIRKYADQLHYWVSKKDDGMYDAINKGFQMSSGEIMYWINSDDITLPNSLFLVAETFQNNSKLRWLTGYPSIINEQGETTWEGHGAPVFSRLFFYSKLYLKSFFFIQQESTYWRRDLWDKAGGYLSTDYSLASDFDLWLRFFRHEKLYYTHHKLGAFRVRSGQKSESREEYLNETLISLRRNLRKMPISFKAFLLLLRGLKLILGLFRSAKFKMVYNKILRKLIGSPNWID